MLERLRSFIRQPWLITLRRLVMVVCCCILIERLAGTLYVWECDLQGYSPLWPVLHWVAVIGLWTAPIVGLLMLGCWWGRRWWYGRRRAHAADAQDSEQGEGVQLELALSYPPSAPTRSRLFRWWDIWLLLLTALICVPWGEWYTYRAANRSELIISCVGQHSSPCRARAEWQSLAAPASAVCEHEPQPAPYLHRFLLPDGDYCVSCARSGEMFNISHIRKTRRFTLRPHFAPEDRVELYICPINTETERKRVRALLQYYMANPQARRPRIRRMPFTRCHDSSVLYLDYGEYVLLPIPLGDKSMFVPALIYISLQP